MHLINKHASDLKEVYTLLEKYLAALLSTLTLPLLT